MKALFDTNIILDVLLEREPFAPLSAELVNRVETGEIEGVLCATTLTTIDYLLGKALSKTQARTAIKTLLNLFQIAEVNKQILSQAADSDFADMVKIRNTRPRYKLITTAIKFNLTHHVTVQP